MAKQLFQLFQARYGDRFLNQFSSGQLDADGIDMGVRQALGEWSRWLLSFSEQEIIAAADASIGTHKRFPPTLPEFRDLCRNEAARRPQALQIPHEPDEPSPEVRERLQRARDAAAQRAEERRLEEIVRASAIAPTVNDRGVS
jgi:hypothetical protein